jgi:hypothetical protein
MGIAPRHAGAKLSRRRGKKKSRIYQLAMLGMISFVFLSPDAREFVLAKWAEVQEYAMSLGAPNPSYPLAAEFTLERHLDLFNEDDSEGRLLEFISIPKDVTSNEKGPVSFAYNDGTNADKSTIQEVLSMELEFIHADKSKETISVPLNGLPIKSFSNAIITADGNKVWWPGPGTGSEKCPHSSPCIRIEYYLGAGQSADIYFRAQIKSTSHSWWQSTSIDSRVEGKSEGVSLARSGTFSEISERGYGQRAIEFADDQWYDRGVDPRTGKDWGWAIDAKQASAPTVVQRAASIEASLPSHLKDNVYAYARATFDWLNLPFLNPNVKYDVNALATARGGEECLADQLGDCDEQSNAFMSIMRVKNVPSWYVFGALADSDYKEWEGHAWAYILIPLSEKWCEDNDIIVQTCYVEGSVDVVNHKWLIHTPTAYIDWIEEGPDTNAAGYYSSGEITSKNCGTTTKPKNCYERVRSFSTHGTPVITGGEPWDNKWVGETLE